MDYRKAAEQIPAEDRPISNKAVSGLGNFFGIYGGEHIAATEFVIGATLVTLGGGKGKRYLFGAFYRQYSRDIDVCADLCADCRGYQADIIFLSQESHGSVYANNLYIR